MPAAIRGARIPPAGNLGRGMEPKHRHGRRPAGAWLHARWVSIVPALILIFFVASAAISPRTTQAVDEPADPIIPATTVPTDTAVQPTPTSAPMVVPTAVDQPVASPVAFAGGLTNAVTVA